MVSEDASFYRSGHFIASERLYSQHPSYQDNYFSLLPGEVRTVQVQFEDKYLAGEEPRLEVEGWNIPVT